jgi:hypothetical protein
MRRKLWLLLVAASFPLLLHACSDKPKMYKPAEYSGKTDSKPWDNDTFKGDQTAWFNAIKARNLGQDEYSRSVSK